MRKIFISILASIVLSSTNGLALVTADASKLTRPWLRQQFEIAENNYQAAQQLSQSIEQSGVLADGDCPVIIHAYDGALKSLHAKFSPNPAQKVQTFYAGMKILDQAVQSSPQDVEVVFLRFATQWHAPIFLRDRTKMAQDLRQIGILLKHKNYSLVDRSMQIRIIDFLLSSDQLNAEDLTSLPKLKSE